MSMADLVLRGGRVMDPETGLDQVADVAITDGRVTAIGADLPLGTRELDARGCIVGPGFVDIHAHGQTLAADRMQAFDGVTTALELEVGALPVSRWYEAQSTRPRALNYGTSAAWLFARQKVLSDITPDATAHSMTAMGPRSANRRWCLEPATEAEAAEIAALVRQALDEGAIGIGIPNGYAAGAGIRELSLVCDLAAERDSVTFTHIANISNIDPKSSLESYLQIIGLAGATGAHMHVCHLNSTSLLDAERSAAVLKKAQAQGLPITVEAYPYGAGSTVVSWDFLTRPGFEERTGSGYDQVQLVRTGERFSDAEGIRAAAEEAPGDLILWHFLDTEQKPGHQALLDISVLYEGGAIASDALPWSQPDGSFYHGSDWPLPAEVSAHPRSAGTFTRFLSAYVRDREAVSLMEGLAKCTLIPARIIEGAAPQMRRKGRLQVGADADVTVFDLEQLADRATFEEMNRPATGVRHLLVGGTPLIKDGELDTEAAPGKPVRGTIA